MSYAIIQTGGKQYKVKSGEILKIEKLPGSKVDSKIEFNDILAYGDDKIIEIGTPTVQGSKVEANLIKNSKNRTVLIFKKRRRKNSRKKYGHRQPISLIRITKIFSKDGKVIAEAGPKKELSKKAFKAEVERKKQINEAQKLQKEKKQEIKKSAKKVEAKQAKDSANDRKKVLKKKPLTTKKK